MPPQESQREHKALPLPRARWVLRAVRPRLVTMASPPSHDGEPTEAELKVLFGSFDVNADGDITQQEFGP